VTEQNKRQAQAYPKDPLEWYVQPRFCVEQLADAVDFGESLIWDPACGSGGILDVFKDRGHDTVGSDVVDRNARHRFYRGNFLQVTTAPKPTGRALDIVCNPPFTKAGAFMHRAISFVPCRMAAFIVPLEFLCSQGRFQFFKRNPPIIIAYCSQRPSMPPGAMVEDMGDRAFKGGKGDFVWIIFAPGHVGPTRSIWLRPSGQ
jgi:hypothetical protein